MPNYDHIVSAHPFEMHPKRFGNAVFYPDLQVLLHQNILPFVLKGAAPFPIIAQCAGFILRICFLTKDLSPFCIPAPSATAGQ